ncbi:unnamed protein product [Peniophora sp. CBMAI 1063]|nr:unnamed protein product [Peniophora sp. CBMAI 1063]
MPARRKAQEIMKKTDGGDQTKTSSPTAIDCLPTEILCDILDLLYELEGESPRALYRFMRLCRRFRDIACSACSLWAQHVLAPMSAIETGDDAETQRRATSLVTTLSERSKPALLSLQLPSGVRAPRSIMDDLFPPLFFRAHSITVGNIRRKRYDVVEFWSYLKTSVDVPNLVSLTAYMSPFAKLANKYTQAFPYHTSTAGRALNLSSLRDLRLVQALPPGPFPDLQSLHIELDDMALDQTSQDFIAYLHHTPQLKRLTLHHCLLDAKGPLDFEPIELSHLEYLQLTCSPTPCALFLERVLFPSSTIVTWKDSELTREFNYDLERMLDALRERLKPTSRRQYSAILRISSTEDDPESTDDLSKDVSSYWAGDLFVTLALYRQMDHHESRPESVDTLENLVVRLDCVGSLKLLKNDNFLLLGQPSSVTSLAVATMDGAANAVWSNHMSEVMHCLAATIAMVLDPSMTPHLQHLRIRELGQYNRSQWDVNPSMLLLGYSADKQLSDGLQ